MPSDTPTVIIRRMTALDSNLARERLEEALATHKILLLEEQARAASIRARQDEARKVIAQCDIEHTASMTLCAAFLTTFELYEALIKISRPASDAGLKTDDVVASVESKPKPAARLGTLRYRLMNALRDGDSLSLDHLAVITHVPARRLKAQIAEDIERGSIAADLQGYSITKLGLDLLQRFEEYRRGLGQQLPPLHDATPGGPDDDVEDDVQPSANEGATENERGKRDEGAK